MKNWNKDELPCGCVGECQGHQQQVADEVLDLRRCLAQAVQDRDTMSNTLKYAQEQGNKRKQELEDLRVLLKQLRESNEKLVVENNEAKKKCCGDLTKTRDERAAQVEEKQKALQQLAKVNEGLIEDNAELTHAWRESDERWASINARLHEDKVALEARVKELGEFHTLTRQQGLDVPSRNKTTPEVLRGYLDQLKADVRRLAKEAETLRIRAEKNQEKVSCENCAHYGEKPNDELAPCGLPCTDFDLWEKKDEYLETLDKLIEYWRKQREEHPDNHAPPCYVDAYQCARKAYCGELKLPPIPERAPERCCKLDTDGDGNCPIHSAPGVKREKPEPKQGLKMPMMKPLGLSSEHSPQPPLAKLVQKALNVKRWFNNTGSIGRMHGRSAIVELVEAGREYEAWKKEQEKVSCETCGRPEAGPNCELPCTEFDLWQRKEEPDWKALAEQLQKDSESKTRMLERSIAREEAAWKGNELAQKVQKVALALYQDNFNRDEHAADCCGTDAVKVIAGRKTWTEFSDTMSTYETTLMAEEKEAPKETWVTPKPEADNCPDIFRRLQCAGGNHESARKMLMLNSVGPQTLCICKHCKCLYAEESSSGSEEES